MSISFVQQHKELYAADFLVTHNGSVIGQLAMTGKLGSMEGTFTGTVMGRQITLAPHAKATGFRPYEIRVDGRVAGTVAQRTVKTGLFSQYQYHEMHLDGQTYELYSVGLGKAGNAACLYCGNTQVAEIDKGTTVYNDLHEYEIFPVDEKSAFACIVISCYRYVRGCYRPGEKAVASKVTHVNVTSNKVLKSKYDPDFKSAHYTL